MDILSKEMAELFKEIKSNSKLLNESLTKAFDFDELNRQYKAKNGYYPLFSGADVLYITDSISKITRAVNSLKLSHYKDFSVLKERDRQIFEKFNVILKKIIICLANKDTHFKEFQIIFNEFYKSHTQIVNIVNTNSTALFAEKREYIEELFKNQTNISNFNDSQDSIASNQDFDEEMDNKYNEVIPENNQLIEVRLNRLEEAFNPNIEKLENDTKSLQELIEKNNELVQINEKNAENNEILIKKLSIIESNDASDKLSSAFRVQKNRLSCSKIIWLLALVIVALLCIGISCHNIANVAVLAGKPFIEIILTVIYKVVLMAPIIYGIFFATKQYSNANKSLEDYTFKETMTLAFMGYRNYIEKNGGDTKILDIKTLEAITNDPLRIYDKNFKAEPIDLESVAKIIENAPIKI